jgi:uncharacterized membrane protein
MTTNLPRPSYQLPKFIRIIIIRPRLFASAALGLLLFLALLVTDSRMPTRVLLGWDLCVALYLLLAFRMAVQSEQEDIRSRARLQDEGQLAILVLTAVAAFASLAAIFALLGTLGGATRQPIHLIFATLTIVLSWAFTHTMFGLHYAHEYYHEEGENGGGLEFPGHDAEPDYLDFFYFSFVIGMCAQVSDITVSCKHIRRTVFAHSIISFIFNAALLALTVNIAASAISSPS